jgi:hypothetical protein
MSYEDTISVARSAVPALLYNDWAGTAMLGVCAWEMKAHIQNWIFLHQEPVLESFGMQGLKIR